MSQDFVFSVLARRKIGDRFQKLNGECVILLQQFGEVRKEE